MELQSKLILLKPNVSYSPLVTSARNVLFPYCLQLHDEVQRGWRGGCVWTVICANMLSHWRIATGNIQTLFYHIQTLNITFITTRADKGVKSFSLSHTLAGSWGFWISQQSSSVSPVEEAVTNFFLIMKPKRLLNISLCCLALKFYFVSVQYLQISFTALKYVFYFDISVLFSSNVSIFTGHKHIKGNK